MAKRVAKKKVHEKKPSVKRMPDLKPGKPGK